MTRRTLLLLLVVGLALAGGLVAWWLTPTRYEPGVTFENYRSLRVGMSYTTICSRLGPPETEFDDVRGYIRVWKGPDAYIHIAFTRAEPELAIAGACSTGQDGASCESLRMSRSPLDTIRDPLHL